MRTSRRSQLQAIASAGWSLPHTFAAPPRMLLIRLKVIGQKWAPAIVGLSPGCIPTPQYDDGDEDTSPKAKGQVDSQTSWLGVDLTEIAEGLCPDTVVLECPADACPVNYGFSGQRIKLHLPN
eukprot:scaffold3597_cov395-Prasinococcus_capsulatus_cf.AAC.7